MKYKIVVLGLAYCITCVLSACSSPDMNTAKRAALQSDYQTSVDHYQRLADFGLPEAQVELGKHYLSGKGVEKDPQKALTLFEQASQKKANPQTRNYIVKTQTELGVLALGNKTASVPPAQGIDLLRKAAEAGDKRALFELGLAYEKGIAVPRNAKLALDYYKKAGELGYGRADYNRANLYEKGVLVKQDLPQAITLYKIAAAKDYPKANVNLAKLYEKKIATKRNSASAAPDLKTLQKN